MFWFRVGHAVFTAPPIVVIWIYMASGDLQQGLALEYWQQLVWTLSYTKKNRYSNGIYYYGSATVGVGGIKVARFPPTLYKNDQS